MGSKTPVFIGSSTEGLAYAESMESIINKDPSGSFDASTWKRIFDSDGTGEYIMPVLERIVNRTPLCIFFITRDDHKIMRGVKGADARTNLWLEIGMFAAKYGRERAVFIVEKDEGPKLIIPSDLLGVNPPSFNVTGQTKKAVRSYAKRHMANVGLTVRPLPPKSASEINRVLRACFKNSIRQKLLDFESHPKEKVTTYDEEDDCYAVAGQMIMDAKEFVYTIAGYENEMNDPDHPDGLLPSIIRRIEHHRQNGGTKSLKIKRLLNLGSEKIREHAGRVLEGYESAIEVSDTYCRFIEVVVTDDEVLIALPKGKHAKNGPGVHIRSRKVARHFMDWFVEYLPAPGSKPLTKRTLTSYLTNPHTRNGGARMDPCSACTIKKLTDPDQVVKVKKPQKKKKR